MHLSVEKKDPSNGKNWALVGCVTGIVVSVAANVARIYIAPENAPDGWTPPLGAIFAAAFWPIALLICVEIISRVQWPDGRSWKLIRYGGLNTVAIIAAIISYHHMSGLLRAYGEFGLGAAIGPLAVDGLMVVSSGALLAIADNVRQSERAAQDAARAADEAAKAPEQPQEAQDMHDAGVGAEVGALADELAAQGLDLPVFLAALEAAASEGEVTGGALRAHLEARGVTADPRATRYALSLMKVRAAENGNGASSAPSEAQPSGNSGELAIIEAEIVEDVPEENHQPAAVR